VAAARLSLKPVDAILIAPGVEIYITEPGSLLAQLRGRSERQLVLGLGALPGLTRGQLRAVVAHEYGHFANDDRTGGSLARRVRVAIWRVARRLSNNGQARWHNPAWLYVSGFQRAFLAISQGATRLQEVMADRSAVMAYGLRDFSDGLQRLVRQAIVFNSLWQQASQAAYNRQGRLANLYDLPEPAVDNGLQKKVDDRMSRPAARYDSHPSPNDRLRLASGAGAPRSLGDDNRPAWGLLADPQTLQLEMVAVLQDQVRR
jgi:Zn-dependent protease with chaperone function